MDDSIGQVYRFKESRAIAVVREITEERHRCSKNSAPGVQFWHSFLYLQRVHVVLHRSVVIDTKALNSKPLNHTHYLFSCKLPCHRHLRNHAHIIK